MTREQNICLVADIDCPHSLIYLEALYRRGIVLRHVIVVRFWEHHKRFSLSWFKRQYNRGLQALQYREDGLRTFLHNWGISYSELTANSFSDSRLIAKLKSLETCAFIYTCGGIVPKSFFHEHNFKFIHCHLGRVPEFRGSDCLFWSILQEETIGASIFYMEERLDRGKLIARMTMPLILPDVADHRLMDRRNFYSYLNSKVDPIVRAEFLSYIMAHFKNHDYRNLPNQEQGWIEKKDHLSLHPSLYPVISTIVARKNWQFASSHTLFERMQIEFASNDHE